MQCINHPEVVASAFCQSCGRPLCASCVERTPVGQVFCSACRATSGAVPPAGAYPPGAYQPAGAPNPGLAAFLGLIPGVGAMYNGQFFKGMVHVVIFAVLVTLTDRYDIVGLFIAAWILYQSFEAFHTARARRDGLPLPDPFGINELGSWLNFGGHSGSTSGAAAGSQPGFTQSGFAQPGAAPAADPTAQPAGDPASTASAPPFAQPFSQPYTGSQPPWPGPTPDYPPVPPSPLGNLPVRAIVLIALGILFLLQTMGFVSDIVSHSWPLLLIGLGVWLILSRTGIGGPRS